MRIPTISSCWLLLPNAATAIVIVASFLCNHCSGSSWWYHCLYYRCCCCCCNLSSVLLMISLGIIVIGLDNCWEFQMVFIYSDIVLLFHCFCFCKFLSGIFIVELLLGVDNFSILAKFLSGSEIILKRMKNLS